MVLFRLGYKNLITWGEETLDNCNKRNKTADNSITSEHTKGTN